jgi:hypothetical protein
MVRPRDTPQSPQPNGTEVKTLIASFLWRFLICCVVVDSHSIFLSVACIAQLAHFSDFRRETTDRKVNEYFGVFLLRTC